MSPMLDDMLVHEIELEFGDTGSLHDVIAPPGYQGQEPDPAEEAARNLDWEKFMATHPPRHRTAILVLVDGVRPGWESDLRTVRDRHLSLVANATEPSRVQPRG